MMGWVCVGGNLSTSYKAKPGLGLGPGYFRLTRFLTIRDYPKGCLGFYHFLMIV